MKILLDTCVHGTVFKSLQAENYDVIWSGNWEVDPGDIAILALAYQQQRILFTLDKDFGELAVAQRHPHFGIVRLVGLSSNQQRQVTLKILQTYSSELQNKAILTADISRVRIRSYD
jgi:predicted nuclease of predicted toxin-antitoxin system